MADPTNSPAPAASPTSPVAPTPAAPATGAAASAPPAVNPLDPIASLPQPVILAKPAFDALRAKYPLAKFPRKKNIALNLGGSMDLVTSSSGTVFGVVRFRKLDAVVTAEVTAALAASAATNPAQ
jgi:hypothetical protein